MHWLTKVLVIFAAVLSVLLAGLTISMASNADRIVSDYEQERARRVAAEAVRADEAGRASQEQSRLAAQGEQLSKDLASRDADVRRLETENSRLLADKNKAEAARQSIEAKIAELGETARTQATLITNYRDEVTLLRKNELSFRQRSIELDDRISDLESQREVLDQTVRALQEQLAEAQLAAQQNLSGTAGGATARANDAVTLGGPLVRGRIEKVETDTATGAILAKINLGTNDSVKENTKLFIGRDREFVANLVIIRSDLQWAVGRIDTLGRNVKVQEGDWVVSRLQ